MKRRALLGLSAGAFVGFAGCSTLNSNADTTPSPEPLGFISMQNRTDEARTIDVVVRRDGDIVHWKPYELRAAGTTSPRNGTNLKVYDERIPADEFDGCTPGAYVIEFRLDDGRRRSVERTAHDHQGFSILLRRDGGISYGHIYERDSAC